MIFDSKTARLLGAHMVGAEVTELIQGYVVAINSRPPKEELMHTVFPSPRSRKRCTKPCPLSTGANI